MNVIDLFAGCGGLSLGFELAGFNIIQAVEFDEKIAASYSANHKGVNLIIDDIKNVDNKKIFKKGSAEVIIGGPPCQGFSMAGARIRDGFIDDPRNYLFKHYFNVVKEVMPKAFIIENVKGLLTMQRGEILRQIFTLFSNSNLLNGHRYFLHYKIVKAVEMGIPQKRERIIILGLLDKDFDLEKEWENTIKIVKQIKPHFFDRTTVKDAIGNLPAPTESGEVDNPTPKTEYQRELFSNSKTIYNHLKTKHSAKCIERIKKIHCGENFTVLDEKINSVHSGSYGRLSWDEPSQTITTRFDTPAGGRFIHPTANRTITPREAARLQSFPDSFVFIGNKSTIAKTIGNAVPPKIGYFLGELIHNILRRK